MAPKVKSTTALFFSLNLFFFALVSSYIVDNNPNGSSYPTKAPNPVVIRPGDKFPNDGSAQSYYGTCNPLNLGVCVNLLGGLVNLNLGNVPTQPCCSLIHGLADLEAAVCLCTAVRANVLDIKLNLPISLSLLLNNCGRRVATEYICAP
ncbi:hypothetical protein ERO13_A10G189700v2 [Gossypium hirsutum]|uniref:14 kDa proline-rich protein DC2.15 n=2 Tax=Gossypium TaxID=3633 RepID=A0ABM2YTU3_GOSHI|nr:14 kDa proline-rich protein DC2.15-like [Gossypium hirsutum]KAG4180841.1 hypothetical protein ERO13_A10G189700v2 [Gossypium hirsutum]TYI07436.1 hypothetical protein ES332_A10G227400v1 [Gossypium tomentosum]